MLRVFLFSALALFSTSASADPAIPSEDLAAKVAGRPLARGEHFVCFARDYDAARLRRHPSQNVRQATLLMHVAPRPYATQTVGVSFQFGFRTLESRKTQVVPTSCELQTDADGRSHIACIDIGCGYSNTVAVVQTGEIGRPRLILATDKMYDDNVPHKEDDPAATGKPIALHSDDRVFILDPAPMAECRPLMAQARRY